MCQIKIVLQKLIRPIFNLKNDTVVVLFVSCAGDTWGCALPVVPDPLT